ncbi:MAG: iron-containing alcohol dehydrogenase [Proteobacteria bacterium]|nr:iron-containing alcohol dehydrogenase [Pseudomonadota bacterium]
MKFSLELSTKIHFGDDALSKAGEESALYAGSGPVMVLTGSGSVHQNGVFQRIAESMEEAAVPFFEFPGVEPNPRVEHIRRAIDQCRKERVELVFAVGGGSCIDAAKAIAAGVGYDGDVWELFTTPAQAPTALKVASALTLSATGSEYNMGTVITNLETKRKLPYLDEKLRPVFSLLDPWATRTVPPHQSAAGVADIFSHLLEQYFSPTVAPVQDRIAEALMTICRDEGPITVHQGDDLEARGNIMLASSLALCGLTGAGKVHDWATHLIEHELSAHFDLTHGVGLAILTPAWMEEVLDDRAVHRFVRYGHIMWGLPENGGLNVATEAIARTRAFFTSLGLPSTLSEVGIGQDLFYQMAHDAVAHFGALGGFRKLGAPDIGRILHRAS